MTFSDYNYRYRNLRPKLEKEISDYELQQVYYQLKPLSLEEINNGPQLFPKALPACNNW